MNRVTLLVWSLLSILGYAAQAQASSSGTVTGVIKTYVNLFGACPAAATDPRCVGWRFTQTDNKSQHGVPDMKFYMVAEGTNEPIGNGVTAADGTFTVAWHSNANTAPTNAHIFWYGEHKDARFWLSTVSGSSWTFTGGSRPISAGHTVAWSTIFMGLSTSPNKLMNVYMGAWRTWTDSLSYSTLLTTNFTGIKIKAWASSTTGDCKTSCSDGSSVTLDDAVSTWQRYPDRVAHEMGHVGSMKSSQQQWSHTCGGDPNARLYDGDAGWEIPSAEWTCFSYEEGYATFLGDVSRCWKNAVAPFTCGGNDCSYELETSSGAPGGPGCATDEGRSALSADRFFWDAYDLNNESNEPHNETYDNLVTGNSKFLVGTGNHDRGEPWTADTGSGQLLLDELDGRSVFDYQQNYFLFRNQLLFQAYSYNCSPPGD